ncbi:MAG: lysophospholipase [Archangium sp.]|nr:lysophospholipase [Archangium sp.]MDP3152017.1 lysophospholipase [Archangium sp.]MDP3575497.1 lysophospholipase [Archangium sp.]
MKTALKSLAVVTVLLVAFLALGVGCAGPAYIAGKRVAPPSPADVMHAEARMKTTDGLELLVQSWRPQGETKGTLIIVHGLKDYADRYLDFALAAARRGYAVHALDLRGHGDSQGDRVWVERFEDYLADLGQFVARVQAAEPNKPLFLLGHSMGGAIATLYTLNEKPKLAGLITSAAALETDAPAGVVKVVSVLTPRLAIFELDDSNFSRDPKVVESMKTDPLIYDGKGPARTASELLGAIASLREKAPTLTVPLLTLHGSIDKVTPPTGSAWLVEQAGSKDKTHRAFPGLAHDLLHEPEREQVIEVILGWLDTHTG